MRPAWHDPNRPELPGAIRNRRATLAVGWTEAYTDPTTRAGRFFAFDRAGDALISALDDSRFLLLEACAPASAH